MKLDSRTVVGRRELLSRSFFCHLGEKLCARDGVAPAERKDTYRREKIGLG